MTAIVQPDIEMADIFKQHPINAITYSICILLLNGSFFNGDD
jgi:hypothetical protein